MTAGCTLVAYFLMSDWPETAKWLSDTERAILKAKIRGDGMVGSMDRLDSKAMRRILLDWKIWFWCVFQSSYYHLKVTAN